MARLEHEAKIGAFLAAGLAVCAAVYQPERRESELPNRIPEPAPYVTAEAQAFPPPYDDQWQGVNNPGRCQSCHERIFAEWNGSMMSNAWRDPLWRAAFLLAARQTSTDGDCAAPDPPDGTARARHNPFAVDGKCASRFDLGDSRHELSRPGSLLDGFCSRCHMPSDYVDNVPLHGVSRDAPSGREHAPLDPGFDPVSDNGSGLAFATVEAQRRNTRSGQSGVSCAICHSLTETRDTPYHTEARAGSPRHPEYVPVPSARPRASVLPKALQDLLQPPDPERGSLGYAIGSGSFRLSPRAIGLPERVGPLTAGDHAGAADVYLGEVFRSEQRLQRADQSKHHGYYHVLLTRAEMCAACHDVTNPLTVKNALGKWAGGFPIERTYTEWAGSRYADRPGNRSFDPRFKRDCQTCHMQQDYGQPGTAQTLYAAGRPRPVIEDRVASDAPPRPYFTHHFVGGNAYVTRMIGADVDAVGTPEPYPELSIFSFSSADERSPYANAVWTDPGRRGPDTQHARLAWDRLRGVLDLTLQGPASAPAGSHAPLRIRVTNTGSGHKFPTGFPEGRIAWLAVRAFDLGGGGELEVFDSFWRRSSRGVGGLTAADGVDPAFPGCDWKLPAGSVDPYAYQFKAVASLGDGCPTLDLAYAHALNLVTNEKGQPLDERGTVIDRGSPAGVPRYLDLDGDGDLYDDSFLRDTRLQPLPLAGSSVELDRYAVVLPPGIRGPVAVSAAVYYQSVEGVVAKKLLGNLADTDGDFRLEPCVLGAACDGRVPASEPAVVEGAPPVPMEVRSWVIRVAGAPPASGPRRPLVVAGHPSPGAGRAHPDVVVKATFSEPVRGVSDETFTLSDANGARVAATVDQIGDGTWALFPVRVFLTPGATYTARLAPGICGASGACTTPRTWSFRVAAADQAPRGDTGVAHGFAGGAPNRIVSTSDAVYDLKGRARPRRVTRALRPLAGRR